MVSKNKKPRVIVLSGPDGVGKSTQKRLLCEELNQNGEKVRTVWLRLRHYSSLPLLALARLLGITTYESIDDYNRQYHEFYRNRLLSKFYPYTLFFDLTITYFFRVWIPFLTGKYVVCDRGPLDTLIDLEFKTGNNIVYSRIGKLFFRLVPEKSTTLVYITDHETIIKRNPELAHEREFQTRIERYRSIAESRDLRIIEANKPIEEVHKETLYEILPNIEVRDREQ